MTGDVTRVDLHVKVLDDEIVHRAKAAGLDVLVYAPHFTHLDDIRERARRYTDDELLVVPARECFADRWNRRRHVLVVDPSEPIPDFLTFEATMDELGRRDETILAPHPEFLTMSLSSEDIHEYRHHFTAVEVFCPKNWWFHTRRMEAIADDVGLPTYASSYTHLPSTIGEAWVEFDGRLESATELKAALADGGPSRLYRNDGIRHLVQRGLEFGHLFYENSWEKFDRVVLQNLEATNPYSQRYDERYAELVAY